MGEAGGDATAPRTATPYVGETCDGEDNDFSGAVDDGLPMLTCTDGSQVPSCVGGLVQKCPCDPAKVGQACDNGKLGACRVAGVLACTDLGPVCSVASDAGPDDAFVGTSVDGGCSCATRPRGAGTGPLAGVVLAVGAAWARRRRRR